MASTLIYTALVGLLVLFVTWVMRKYFKVLKMKGNIPGPTIYPLILNDYLLWTRPRYQVLKELFEKYGETTYIFSNFYFQILTINPDNIQHVISQQHNFTNYKRVNNQSASTELFLAKHFLGNGIFFADDEIWEHQRFHANPMFKKNKYR